MACRFAHGLSLVVRGADRGGFIRTLAELDTVRHSEYPLRIPVGRSSLTARISRPVTESSQTVLIVTGLHPAGIDEPRLVALARELAKSNVTVVTPEIAELSRFEITPAVTDRIEQASHDYGVAVVLLNLVDHVVPPEQVSLLRDAVSHAEAPALSPSRSPAPTVPVFLLHGRHDTVIPAAESVYLAERLRTRSVPVRLLLTDLITHASADRPAGVLDIWRLTRFWGDLLAR